ncbi:MAG TPA: hypothetical protein VFK89_05920, partial [Actinomycetota bacterium]|nr:hypothetical protein [Actinomycetota bacterium]
MAVKHWMAVVLAVAVLGAGACATGPAELGAMQIQRASGHVEILRGSDSIDVSDVEGLEPGDVIVTGATGTAHLNLASDAQRVDIAPDSRVRVRSNSVVEGLEGSLLARASHAPTSVLFDGVKAEFSNARFRLDRGFSSSRAASYDGTVELGSPGETRIDLQRLYQVDVAAGDLPEHPVPYRVDE